MSATRICPLCSTQYEDDQRFCQRDGSTLKSISGTADLVGSVVADRYHVIKKLGEGGMGQVYLAEHVRMGRKSAVKVMHAGMVDDADAVSRFNREAANASRINHPNVAAIYDFGETSDGLIYLAMEYIEGEPLTSSIERGALPVARAASIIRQTGEALTAAHELGIVHRDLKPDNIMIARNRDGSDCVKVVDFGIAKAANVEAQKVTRTGLIVGTPEYMSPEQLAGDPLDGRSDVYSLALVAFAALTGRLPFPSETVQASMIMRLTERPRSLAEMKPDVRWSPELQAVMDRALAREAASRYDSAAKFGREFADASDSMPQTASVDAATSIIASASIPATVVAPAPTRITASSRPATRSPSRIPLLLGGAAVVAGAAVGFGLLRANRAPGDQRDSTALAAIGAPNGAQPAAAAPRTDTATAVTTGSARPANRKPTEASDHDALSPDAIKAEITAIKDLALGDRTAAEAIRRAEKLLPELLNGNDSAEVLLHESDAYTTQGDQANSCNTLKRIGRRGNSIVRESVVSGLQICSTT